MGDLIEYYIILATVEYTNDPLLMGRIKCHIPGVMHTYVTEEDALPWIRPFSMNAYQSFSKPIKGQKVWVLASKTNINEYWWFPYFETTELTQDYLDIYYDKNPDVIHSRDTGQAMITYDETQGYGMKIGGSQINLNHEYLNMNVNDCQIRIAGNHINMGVGTDGSNYDPVVSAKKLKEYFNTLSQQFEALKVAASPYMTYHLQAAIENIANTLSSVKDKQISFDNVSAN